MNYLNQHSQIQEWHYYISDLYIFLLTIDENTAIVNRLIRILDCYSLINKQPKLIDKL
jgi:hypothetical protein